jgi:xanthine dehydrogenase accessory factor
MSAATSRRAQELAAAGEPFVTATVVRAQRPTSVVAGDVAIVLADGTIEGFVGGACAEHSVRAYSLTAIESGEAVLLRILPFADPQEPGDEIVDGAVTVENPCLSGGAIEVFLEPVLSSPRVLVVGETPIAAAVARIGAELGLEIATAGGDAAAPRPDDLALVVAAHGRDEVAALRGGLEAGLPYVGLVASRARGDGVLGELRGDGVPDELLARIEVPAGIDIHARTPAEIALSILARIVAVRHADAPAPAPRHAPAVPPAGTAVDPICGMTVAAVPSTPHVEHEGETVYFCCDGCMAAFQARHEHADAGGE